MRVGVRTSLTDRMQAVLQIEGVFWMRDPDPRTLSYPFGGSCTIPRVTFATTNHALAIYGAIIATLSAIVGYKAFVRAGSDVLVEVSLGPPDPLFQVVICCSGL